LEGPGLTAAQARNYGKQFGSDSDVPADNPRQVSDIRAVQQIFFKAISGTGAGTTTFATDNDGPMAEILEDRAGPRVGLCCRDDHWFHFAATVQSEL
jgi:hypothetical protein